MPIPFVPSLIGKEVAKKETMKKITHQNALIEMVEFNEEYATDKIEIFDGEKIVRREVEKEENKVSETVKEVVDDLAGAKEKTNVQMESTDELIEDIEKQAQETTKAMSKTKEKFENGNPKKIKEAVQSLPTVGGIGLLLAIIIFILFAIQPVNGNTRLSLFWNSLIGRTYIGDNDPTKKKTFFTSVEGAVDSVIEGTKELPRNIFDGIQESGNVVGNAIGDVVFDPLGDWLGGMFK